LRGKAGRIDNATNQNSKLILAAMIFAVSMTFIDQTIFAIAIPTIQKDLSLTTTGVQWIVNGYLLALSALFAFGGRLADIAGHRGWSSPASSSSPPPPRSAAPPPPARWTSPR
jgi:MFS family permease